MNNAVAFTKYDKKIGIYQTQVYLRQSQVAECKICVNKNTNTWSITSWYTRPENQKHGYGVFAMRATLKTMLRDQGYPQNIEYVWNGANQYVMDWLTRHFSPVSKLPVAVQKYQEIDDWDAHIYILNREAIIKYFDVTPDP